MYYHLFKRKGIVLVLNSLDSLGDDQVRCSSGFLLHGKSVMIANSPSFLFDFSGQREGAGEYICNQFE
jgi:hypothetical protein